MAEVDVRLVKSFVAVADERSFTRAAGRLHVAQPWLSVQIRKFEEQVGFQLFARNRNQGVVPSPRAEALLPAARDYLAAAERMSGIARRLRDHSGTTLKVGAPDFSAEMPMRTAIMDTFEAAHSDIELEVSNAWTVELLARVRLSELDVAFTVGPHTDSATEAMVLARYRLSLLARALDFPDHVGPIEMSALEGREVAIFRRNVNAAFHDSIAPILEAHGIRVAHLAESGLPSIFHNCQRTGMLSIIGNYTQPAQIPCSLVMIPIAGAELAFNLNLVRRMGNRTPAVVALWAHAMRTRATL